VSGPAGLSDSVGAAISPAGHSGEEGEQARLTVWVQGRVQGVGFRWWVRYRARELGLVGVAENLADSRVKVIAEGSRDSCQDLLTHLESTDSPGHVVQVTYRWDQPRGDLTDFVER
jgi:acylphosphatase